MSRDQSSSTQEDSDISDQAIDRAVEKIRTKLDSYEGEGGATQTAAEKGHELVDELESTLRDLAGSNDGKK
ncbi:hypothetical protein [Haloarchaeobius amylolyticus]|uniref:hypothetical protein n=1 Tax=Haloarchaeobius amylolyticus TaxID=1198296 RepID=UPI002270E184|nr:hypothetical protein [Haloarchaeobius amylolyticus]